MPTRTPVISYNLNERGRDYTGQNRAIDIDAAMRFINHPATQESVRKGDYFGYVGHGFREKYGLAVPETVIEGGKTVVLEPAVKTVLLKCMPDGTVQHQQEFLDTGPGRVAARLYQSKNWGFSSVFFAPDVNGKRTMKQYFGMDFVRSPNYDTNRGYAAMLDSMDAGALSSGGFAQDYGDMMDSVDKVLAENDALAADISKAYLTQCAANDELVDHIARLTERLKAGGGMLDSTSAEKLERGTSYMPSRANEMLDSADRFMRADLDALQAEVVPPKEEETSGFLAKGRSLVSQVLGLR
jgi:hypothetical protein